MPKYPFLFLLKICAFFVFFGRGYEHIFWDAPFRSFLWDEKLLSPIVEGIFNTEWRHYATSLKTDFIIQSCIKINGIFYLLCAALCLSITENSKKISRYLIFTGGAFLVVLSLLITKSKFYHTVMFFEHSIQFATPFALLFFLKTNNFKSLLLFLKILIAFTFISHGMYAIGVFYPLPGNFVTMTLNILPVSENSAKQFLFLAGVIDFLVAILIFIPKTAKVALMYTAIWGILTAFARIISGLTYDVSFKIFHQYLYATIYRIPHGLIPYVAYLITKKREFSQKN